MSISSSDSETTYSEDERYEVYIKKRQEEEAENANRVNETRRKIYENYVQERYSNLPSTIFSKGLSIPTFTHEKIQFSFNPSEVAQYVSSSVQFHCTLKYNKYWLVNRDSFPVDIKSEIYQLFFHKKSIDDSNIVCCLEVIYKILCDWAHRHSEHRQKKFARYQNGEDVELDEDDQELFLTQTERGDYRRNKEAILKRMLPPITQNRNATQINK